MFTACTYMHMCMVYMQLSPRRLSLQRTQRYATSEALVKARSKREVSASAAALLSLGCHLPRLPLPRLHFPLSPVPPVH